jgi:hypothetical protein
VERERSGQPIWHVIGGCRRYAASRASCSASGHFVWPESTLAALVLVFGAYVFVDGIFAVVTGIGMLRQLSFW